MKSLKTNIIKKEVYDYIKELLMLLDNEFSKNGAKARITFDENLVISIIIDNEFIDITLDYEVIEVKELFESIKSDIEDFIEENN